MENEIVEVTTAVEETSTKKNCAGGIIAGVAGLGLVVYGIVRFFKKRKQNKVAAKTEENTLI